MRDSKIGKVRAMCDRVSVLKVEPGRYEIGSDRVLNASPKHRRNLRNRIWILSHPFSIKMFEELLLNVKIVSKLGQFRTLGLDSRVKQLFDHSFACARQLGHSFSPSKIPLTGLSFYECSGIAASLDGRLPTELEWEIAIRKMNPRRIDIQEWTMEEG